MIQIKDKEKRKEKKNKNKNKNPSLRGPVSDEINGDVMLIYNIILCLFITTSLF